MIDQKESDEYREAWLKAEREAIISEFQSDNPWGWGSGEGIESSDESDVVVPELPILGKADLPTESTKGAFIKALKKVTRSFDGAKS